MSSKASPDCLRWYMSSRCAPSHFTGISDFASTYAESDDLITREVRPRRKEMREKSIKIYACVGYSTFPDSRGQR